MRMGVPPHIRKRRFRLGLAVLLLLAITAGAIGWWLGTGRWTDVPSLVGQSQENAIGQLQEAGLDPAFAEEQFSEDTPQGTVISADPSGGRLIRGTDVTLVVSKGPERFAVDAALLGQPLEDVRTALAEVPVTLETAEDYDQSIPAGSVIRFDPAPGAELKRGDTVTAVVSEGRAPVEVPDVVGQDPEAATKNLEQLGFTVQRSEGRSSDVPKGAVMAVEPSPSGDAQPYGSTVTITVSVGVPQVTVPDVRGMSKDEAVAALEAVGLKAETVTFVVGNKVFQQSPKKDEVVDEGTSVKILLSF
jgi:beta-lactam-binding protein with PASTA domain